MIEALADLKGKAMSVKDLALRQKLLNRYNKIQIIEEEVFDEE